MNSHLIDEAVKQGATVIRPEDWRTGTLRVPGKAPFCLCHWVEAPIQGVKDPTLWGHIQPDETKPGGAYYCTGRMFDDETASEAEEAAA